MKDKRLAVSLPACPVGELSQERTGRVHWKPDASWERNRQEPRLGLDFLRKPGPRSTATDLPCWFENLLPERGTQLRKRLSMIHSLREGQSFELLRALGGDLLGAVEARGDGPWPADDAGPPSSGTGAPAAEGDDLPPRMSALTGVQLKFSMSMVNERLVLAARRGHSLWIVKIADRDYDGIASVEQATMTWARHAGFTVPDHFEVPFDRLVGIPEGWTQGRAPAFAVRRFDRREDGSKVHQEDLCQALEVRPSNKYGDGVPGVSFEGALKVVTDACGEGEGREMARRIGFMIASGNGDAHLKNWGLVWGDSLRPALAPCYDLVATITWEDRLGWKGARPGPELALKLGRRKLFRQLDESALSAFAESTHRWAEEEVRSGILRARDAWSMVAETAPPRMRAALSDHWRAVPLLVQMGPFAGST
jgi:serine/threonine-protein kinase HipA